MVKLIRTDMYSFFEVIRYIKDCIDSCNDDVSHLFKLFPREADEAEFCAREALEYLPYTTDFDWLYYEWDMELPEEDRETAGEVWTFSDENMVEYYKLLNELLKQGKISKTDFVLHKENTEVYIHNNILDNQDCYGIGYDLNYAEKENDKDCIRVYLDYSSGFSQFVLYCGIISIFDRYKTKLEELRCTYCNTEKLPEAA